MEKIEGEVTVAEYLGYFTDREDSIFSRHLKVFGMGDLKGKYDCPISLSVLLTWEISYGRVLDMTSEFQVLLKQNVF